MDIMIVICNCKKVGHNGPEETTMAELGVGLYIKMVTIDGRYAGAGRRGGL